MSVTLANVRFYRPPSLPARPPKASHPPSLQSPLPSQTLNATYHPNPPSGRCSRLPSLPPAQALHWPLPPRPPVDAPSGGRSLPALDASPPLGIGNTSDHHNAYPNDFDQALQAVAYVAGDGRFEREDTDEENQDYCHLGTAEGITQGADKYSTQNPTSSNVNSENDVTANLPSPHLSQKGLWESVQSGRPIQSHCTANMEPKDRIHRARSAAQKIPPPVSLTFNDQTSASITNLNSIYPDIVLNTQSLVEDGSAMASEQVAKSPHTREVRDIQDIGRSMGDMESCEDMKSGVEQRITESGGVESSDTPVDPIHHASPQLDESNFALSNQSLRISSLLPPPPAVVIPAPFHGLSALLEGTATRQHNDDGPAADRSVLQAEYGSPTQIPVEEDDCHSVTSDDDNDSDYLEDVETGALDAEERLPPSKRHKRNHSLEANLPKCLGSDLSPSARFSSQHDHSRELASKSHSLESKPIPVQGFLTLQNCGSDIIYCLKFSQTHFASFFADDQTREARRKTRRTRNSVRRVRFSQEEDALIVQLKEKMNLMWDEIEDRFAEQFSYRSKSSLQGHYSTRLKQPSRQ